MFCHLYFWSPNGIVNDCFVALKNNILVKAANGNSYYSIIVGDNILNCNDLSHNYPQLVNNHGCINPINCSTRLSL